MRHCLTLYREGKGGGKLGPARMGRMYVRHFSPKVLRTIPGTHAVLLEPNPAVYQRLSVRIQQTFPAERVRRATLRAPVTQCLVTFFAQYL